MQRISLRCHSDATCLEKTNSCLLHIYRRITVLSLYIGQTSIPATVILLPSILLALVPFSCQGLLLRNTFC